MAKGCLKVRKVEVPETIEELMDEERVTVLFEIAVIVAAVSVSGAVEPKKTLSPTASPVFAPTVIVVEFEAA